MRMDNLKTFWKWEMDDKQEEQATKQKEQNNVIAAGGVFKTTGLWLIHALIGDNLCKSSTNKRSNT